MNNNMQPGIFLSPNMPPNMPSNMPPNMLPQGPPLLRMPAPPVPRSMHPQYSMHPMQQVNQDVGHHPGGMPSGREGQGMPNAGMKRPFNDISNDQQDLVRGTLLENESSKIDIKEDGFYSGPYRQERMIVLDVERYIEEEELKDELTVGDRTGKALFCPW